jgi:hypothetical protein
MNRCVRGCTHLATRTPRAAGTAAAAKTESAFATVASTCSVGELRAGEKGSGPDLDGDDVGAMLERRGPPVDGSMAADNGGTETENIETAVNEP